MRFVVEAARRWLSRPHPLPDAFLVASKDTTDDETRAKIDAYMHAVRTRLEALKQEVDVLGRREWS